MANQNISFLDLQAQYRTIKPEIEDAISEVLNTSTYALGPAVERFEADFAVYCDVEHAVACNSGTSALHLALCAYDIGPGDEIITVSHTFIATVWAVTYCGATPVFVDVNPVTKTIDVTQIEPRITSRTKAIIPVHLYGHPADMTPIIEIADRYGLVVIEDAAQAHGALYKGRKAGSIADAACFSFYPGKNLGAYGEGGAVVTNDSSIAQKLRMLRNHGQSVRYHHDIVGYNYRMDGIQGAVLGVKLKYIDEWNDRRRKVASQYNEMLAGLSELDLPMTAEWAEHVFHLYVIHHSQRFRLQQLLAERGIGTGIHYPVPVHLQKAYANLTYNEKSLLVTEKLADTCLSLPIYPEMTDEMVNTVCESVKASIRML